MLKQMTVEDINTVVDIYAKCFSFFSIGFNELSEGKLDNVSAARMFRGQLYTILGATNHCNLVYVDDADEILGFIITSLTLAKGGHMECWIEDWCVLPDERGKGIGKALLYEVIEWANVYGVKYMFSEFGTQNSLAQTSIGKLGFKHTASVYMRKL